MIAGIIFFVPKYSYMACAWAGFAGYAASMVLSYVVGQKLYPINYPIKNIMSYVVLAGVIFFAMTFANNYLSNYLSLFINTILIVLFMARIVKYDFPLKNMPIIGKYFKK